MGDHSGGLLFLDGHKSVGYSSSRVTHFGVKVG
jgi:hypothetical protein